MVPAACTRLCTVTVVENVISSGLTHHTLQGFNRCLMSCKDVQSRKETPNLSLNSIQL